MNYLLVLFENIVSSRIYYIFIVGNPNLIVISFYHFYPNTLLMALAISTLSAGLDINARIPISTLTLSHPFFRILFEKLV